MNKLINLISVEVCVRDLCNKDIGKKFETIDLPVFLNDNGQLNEYVTSICFPDEERENVIKNVKDNEGKTLNEFINGIDKRYCHICTCERFYHDIYLVSFEDNGYPAQVKFSDSYPFVINFFKKYISERNELIDNKIRVPASDFDLGEYFDSCFSINTYAKKQKKKKKSVDK